LRESKKFFNAHDDLFLYTHDCYNLKPFADKLKFKSLFLDLYPPQSLIIDHTSNIENIKNLHKRPYKFLFLGGKPRVFRLRYYDFLMSLKSFSDFSLYSTQSGSFFCPTRKKNIYIKPKVLDLPLRFSPPWITEDEAKETNINFHMKSYINLVPMTFFEYDPTRLDINEKLYKPMSMLQPFVLLGEPFTLGALREMGYKTFDKWFDESYDVIIDDEKRFRKVCELTNTLNDLSIDEMALMMKDMLPVLIHNYELLKERKLSLYHEKRILEGIKTEFNIK
jgi:hypothetical protein